MNRLLKLGLAALLATCLAFPVYALAQMAIDADSANTMISFSHSQHPGLACSMCHTTERTSPAPEHALLLTSIPQSCYNCHGITESGEMPIDGCANCHNDVSPK